MALFGKVADDPERFIELCRSNSPPPRFSSDPCPLARLLLPPAKFSELPELLCDSSSNWFQRNVYKPNQVFGNRKKTQINYPEFIIVFGYHSRIWFSTGIFAAVSTGTMAGKTAISTFFISSTTLWQS